MATRKARQEVSRPAAGGAGPGATVQGAVSVSLRLEYPSPAKAAEVFGAVAVDDDGFVQTRLEGRAIVADVSGPDALCVKRAVDDLLACVAAAEGALQDRPDPEDAENEE